MQRELWPLVRALNHFTERLRGQFERQAQFIAEAAHELRTPLAALKARLELGLRASEPDTWRATLESAAQGTDRLTHLANQLLSLARVENGARAIAEGGAQLLDLSQLARELGMAMAPLAHARGVALALEADEPVWLRGEPTLLNELLSNLVDNALAHTPPGGNVVLRVSPPGVLEVEDDGPGIPWKTVTGSSSASTGAISRVRVRAWGWRSSVRSVARTWHRSACTMASRRG
ncbi:hypothetical protein PBOI14_18180 [Pseudomonas sp. Boi14]|nr:hypothetical protein PBOI14_18180 [Pseudomonas sp. Boi14]